MPLPSVPPGLEVQADLDLDHLRAAYVTIQPSVLAAEGRYLQTLPQPSGVPADGAALPVDATATRPLDRSTSLSDDDGTFRQANAQIQTSTYEYEGPQGNGWGFLQCVELAGDLWVRVTHESGPESWRSYDWSKEDAT